MADLIIFCVVAERVASAVCIPIPHNLANFSASIPFLLWVDTADVQNTGCVIRDGESKTVDILLSIRASKLALEVT